MDSGIRLELAKEDDLAEITEIYNSTIPLGYVTADQTMLRQEDRREWFRLHQAPFALYSIYLEGQAEEGIVAYAALSPYKTRAAYNITAEVAIYIHPDHRAKGLGHVILTELTAKAREIGFEKLLAVIFAHNAPSIYLFRKFGFEQWGLLPEVTLVKDKRYDVSLLGLSLL